MPPTFHRDEEPLFSWVGDGGVKALPIAPPAPVGLPPLRRRPPPSSSSSSFLASSAGVSVVMLLRRPRRWLQFFGGTVIGLLVGFFVSMATRDPGQGQPGPCGAQQDELPAPFPAWGPGPAGGPDSFWTAAGPESGRDPLRLLEPDRPAGDPRATRRSLVLVGVMTADKYLSTRAAAVWDTWGRELPGRIAFFSAGTSKPPSNRPNLPLVALKGVDDSYPPQKKSFRMLEYMWEQYGEHFEWFLRADDDVYVRPDKLEKLLRSVDSSKPQFIGQAGRGNQEEFGLLSLEFDENFCMGGPGVLLSRATLARVAPHVKNCLRNLYTTHEDVELGRCVQRYAGIPCTWSYEMQTILYHNSSGKDAFTGNLKQREVHRAITLHPVKQHRHMYRVHNYMRQLKIQESWQAALELHRDIHSMASLLGHRPEDVASLKLATNVPLYTSKIGEIDYLGDSYLLGKQPSLSKLRPRTEDEVLHWDFISRSLFSEGHSNPRRKLESALKEGLDDVVREVMDMINMFSKQRGRVIEFREIMYGYHRLSPQYGADYILDLLLVYKKYRGKKMTVPVRRHAYLQQQFTGLHIRESVEGVEVRHGPHDPAPAGEDAEETPEEPSLADALENGLLRIGEVLPAILGHEVGGDAPRDRVRHKMINFVLPLSGRYSAFSRFIAQFEEVCLRAEEQVSLYVILFMVAEDNAVNQTTSLVTDLQQRYPRHRLSVVPVWDTFARALALETGAAQVRDEDLLFFIDVDMVFTAASLERVRLNTIRGVQVYFPIVFSEFDPATVYGDAGVKVSPDHFALNQDAGFWRQYGFGIVSVYKSDLRMVGGFDTSIRGWGKEDVDLYDKFVAAADNITVFRAVDPHLVHVFHIVDCDPRLDPVQLKMCRGTRADTLGSVERLAQAIYSQKKAIFEFARSRRFATTPPHS